ncbi:MAG TPA: tetraacyldisaccharide 4'-kinase [Saprospiraceae bacterium]|nr:tetraacyldisaccharide 4'-kinase [Saprospiraceae bacterium]
MRNNWVAKILLAPISLLYGIGISVRHFLYQSGTYKRAEFDVPIISVGNLSTGGTGKSPHVEYLIMLLRPYLDIATLSRGYGRKTHGFRIVTSADTAESVGDEPLQFKRKFQDVLVTVGEERMMAIPQIMGHSPNIQTILLDDAYQHLAVKPSLNILLTSYKRPYFKDFLLPSGNLREWRSGSQRADIIIVTKCPDDITNQHRQKYLKKIQPLPHQKVFFSKYGYGAPYYLYNGNQRIHLTKDFTVVLISGIAQPDYLIYHLESLVKETFIAEFADHHPFTVKDMDSIQALFHKVGGDKKIYITTEKDAIRLDAHRQYIIDHKMPIFILPAGVEFLFGQKEEFDEAIKEFLMEFKV